MEVIEGDPTGWFLDSDALVKGSKEGTEKRSIEKAVRDGVFLGNKPLAE